MRTLLRSLVEGRVTRLAFIALTPPVGAGLIALLIQTPMLPLMGVWSWPLVWAGLWLLSGRLADAGLSLWRLAGPVAGTVLAIGSAFFALGAAMAGWETPFYVLLTIAAIVALGAWVPFLILLATAPSTAAAPKPVDFDRFAYAVTTLALCALVAGAMIFLSPLAPLGWGGAFLVWVLFRLMGLRLRDMGVTRWIIALPVAVTAGAGTIAWLLLRRATDLPEPLVWLAAAVAALWLAVFLWLSAMPTARNRMDPP